MSISVPQILSSVTGRTSLSFEHTDPFDSDGESVEAALETVESLRQTLEIDRPKVFNTLVHQMRKLK